MHKCSIVIRCHNEAKHIDRLFRGIFQQTVRPVEVIVVDSGSTDGTLEIVSRYPVKILHIPASEFSFGRSLNMGCQAAAGEIVVVASAHVYPVYDTWLELLLAPFADPQVALVYGKQRGNGTTKYSERQIFARWYAERSNTDQDHPFCNNANAAIRRSLWERMPYDETLTGLEDIEWASRAIHAGYKIAYAAGAEIVHVHNETPREICNRYRREAITFKRIFPHERFHVGNFLGLVISNVASDYYHAGREGVLLRNLLAIPVFRLMQFWGTYRGFGQRGPVSEQLRQVFYYPPGIKHQEKKPEGNNGRAIAYDKEAKEEHSVG